MFPLRACAAPDCASCAMASRRRGPEAAASCGRDNPTHETGPYGPVRSIFIEKTSGEDRCVRMTRGTRLRRVLRGQRGWRRGRQRIPLTLLTQEPRNGGCPQRSTGRRARRQESRGVAITVSNDVCVSPTDEGAGAAPVDEVRHEARRPRTAACGSPSSHRTEGNQRHSYQNRGRRAPNAHRAEERCPADLLLGALGVGANFNTSVR